MNVKKKFLPAIHGLSIACKDRSFQIQLMFAVLAGIVGFILQFTVSQWLWIILMITLVLTTEIINTAIEQICNFICPQQDARIGIIKDLAAGAVLCSSCGALIVGLWFVISHFI